MLYTIEDNIVTVFVISLWGHYGDKWLKSSLSYVFELIDFETSGRLRAGRKCFEGF
jgi:hypothetical protein